MNEGVVFTAEAAPPGGSAAPGTAGTLLRMAREAAGMHIEALAVTLKVPVARVRALEADDYAVLTDAVFARALASSICRVLKIDAVPILALMPTGQVPRLEPQLQNTKATFRDGTEPSRVGPMLAWVRQPTFIVVALLLAGAGVLLWAPGWVEQAAVWADKARASVSALQPAPAPASTAADPVISKPPAVQHAQSPAPAPVGQVPLPAVTAVTPPPAQVASAAVATASSPDAMAPAVNASDVLVLRANQPSWVQVRDAAGTTLLQRIVAAGETVTPQGKLPLAVVIGKADATEVFIRGQRFDLTGASRENVARFEVKP